MTRLSHTELKKKALSKSEVKIAFDALEEEFSLFEEIVKVRLKLGKTQEEVAKIMKTSTSVVGRLETCGGKHKHSPTLATLRKYAKALNCDLRIKLVPHKV